MAAPNLPIQFIKKVKQELDTKSPSFCLAKWLQVTIHLQTGQTHSCHHPRTHAIPLEELQQDPSALHNTSFKKTIRKELLEGIKSEECTYCWEIEAVESFSDRHIKSAQPWAYPRLEEVKALPWDSSVNPSYVEVSFGNECNFKCAYCAPHISSSIMNEVKKFGPYSSMGGFSEENLRASGLMPYSKDEENPYVDAFWKWWPGLSKDLTVFRITGGEPLLNPNTFRFLEYLKTNPMPHLTVAINSNLGVPKKTFERFIKEIKEITSRKLVKEFQLFTSVDTHGKNAEFIRMGLDYGQLMENAKYFLEEVKDSELIFMCTYNAFSVINFRTFLKEIAALKAQYLDSQGVTRVTLDIPYLKEPSFLSCYVLTADFLPIVEGDLTYLKANSTHFLETEITKLERILTWLRSLEENEHRDNNRRELMVFLREYCERKNITLDAYLSEYRPFFTYCESLLESR